MESTLGATPETVGSGLREPRKVKVLGRFELGELLGEGGMGRVYEAYDPRLSRTVAVKVLRGESAESVRRFIREARAQAHLSHEAICPVFEAGEVDGAPYIVMQRLHGRPLEEAAREWSLEQKLDVLRRVAEAVHEAHRSGLIHRDLKPGNILVESRRDGRLKPYVLDFGLARQTTPEASFQEALTVEGSALGTPAFMAPEQVRGKAELQDRRTDVYALGATLYRLLAGRGPYCEEGLDLLRAIVEGEPAPLSPAQAPPEVAAIVFRCLEKDPGRRYGSARALAEDLGRYLDGEPVLARPAGRWYRLRKLLIRHAALTMVSGASLMLLLLAFGWGWLNAWRGEARQRWILEFTEQVEEVEALARYSHLSPLHDVRPDRRLLRRKMETIRQMMGQAGDLGRGVGLYALGRGSLTLEDLEAARRYLEGAWAAGYRAPEVAAARAQALSALYRQHLAAVDLVRDWEARDRLRQGLEERYGTPARILLAARTKAEASSEGGRQDQALLAALSAFHQNRFQVALAILEQADGRQPWRYELDKLEGDVHRAWAARLHAGGDGERARDELRRAREAYRRAARVAQSDPSVHRVEAEAVALELGFEVLRGEDLSEVFEAGRASVRRALTADPDDPRSLLWKARLHRLMAQSLRTRSQDPTAHLALAREAAEAAEAGLEDPSEALRELARIAWGNAQWRRRRGEDPNAEIEATIEALERVEEPWRDFIYYNTLGMAHGTLADHRLTRGQDAGASLDRAIHAYRQAIERHSAPFAALSNLGASLLKKTDLPGTPDPVATLEDAVRVLLRARSLEPDHVAPHYYLGRCYLRLAQGGDGASGLLDERALLAAQSYERALAENPAMAQLHNALGEVRHLQALAAWDRGEDPDPFFRLARQAYRRGLAQAPGEVLLHQNLAWTAYFQAKFRVRQGEEAGALLAEAAAEARRALAGARLPGAMLCLASVHRIRAEHEMARGGDPGASLAKAEAELRRLLELNPHHPEAHRSLGRLKTLEATFRSARGQSAGASLEAARSALDRALELAPGVASFWSADARWALAAGRWQTSEGGRKILRRGAASADRALSLRPGWPEARALRQALLLTADGGGEGGLEAGRGVLAAALADNPHLSEEWGSFLRVPRR